MSYSPRLVDTLNGIAHRYKDIIERAINDVLKDPRYRNTGRLAASVTVDVVDGDSGKSPVIRIEMDEALLIIDKRKIQWTQLPNMRALLEWAATKESDPTRAKRLAFATAWDKKTNDTWKPKSWRKKSLSAVLKELNALVLSEFDRAIDADLQIAAAA
jgi:hypothetical protein